MYNPSSVEMTDTLAIVIVSLYYICTHAPYTVSFITKYNKFDILSDHIFNK